jgi:prepilin-type N-terminal cleavage/methylation domain-containing protein
MRDTKGFTLVELLAVIVILAIVALVTTPAILNVINNSRQKAAEDKAWGTIDSVRLAYTQAQNNGYDDTSGTGVSFSGNSINVSFGENGEAITPKFGSNTVTMSGEKPSDGTVTIDKSTGNITCKNLKFTVNGTYYCSTTTDNKMECGKTPKE